MKTFYLLLVVGNRWDVAAFILMARRKTLSGAFSRMPVQPPLAGQVRELRSLEFSESLAVSGRQVIKAPLEGMHAAMRRQTMVSHTWHAHVFEFVERSVSPLTFPRGLRADAGS